MIGQFRGNMAGTSHGGDLLVRALASHRSPVRRFFRTSAYAGVNPAPVSYGRIGNLEVRLATNRGDVRRAQNLRYRVFYKELDAKARGTGALLRRDIDGYDAHCDHLLVVDHGRMRRTPTGMKPEVVGTYRLLRQPVAEATGGFYSRGEYEIDALVARHPGLQFLELGRSCVLKEYRNKRTVELLWQGLWAYIQQYHVDVLIGCASLEGTDPARQALPLSFLYHHVQADPEWTARAVRGRGVAMDLMPKDKVDPRVALRGLPPLIKGYLRCGAKFSPEAVIDPEFGTTDVFVVMPIAQIDPRYIDYFGGQEAEVS
ncbi:MAG: GNAT family N-acetyltransferase [Flavobacteriaceae bacterium]